MIKNKAGSKNSLAWEYRGRGFWPRHKQLKTSLLMNEMTRCKRIRFPRVTPKGTSLQRRETDIQEVQPKEALMVKRYLSADLVLRSFPILLLFLEVHIVTSQQALTPAVLSLCAWTVSYFELHWYCAMWFLRVMLIFSGYRTDYHWHLKTCQHPVLIPLSEFL